MIVFDVNEIEEFNNSTHGIVDFKNLVLDIYSLTFGLEKADSLEKLLDLAEEVDENNQSFFFIKRFYQYIGVIEFKGETLLSLTLSDFKNDASTLDAYLDKRAQQWSQLDRNKYVQIFQEILSDSELEKAELYALNIF